MLSTSQQRGARSKFKRFVVEINPLTARISCSALVPKLIHHSARTTSEYKCWCSTKSKSCRVQNLVKIGSPNDNWRPDCTVFFTCTVNKHSDSG
eukprot:m.390823 g.390823  ORF g.390823 m.390823 type:complete len:94 (-) comp16757_c0_seq2:2818-3099(-)